MTRYLPFLMLFATFIKGLGASSYNRDKCMEPKQTYVDDYKVLSSDVSGRLECTILAEFHGCEKFLFRGSENICVCIFTDSGTSASDLSLIEDLKRNIKDAENPTEYYELNPVAFTCQDSTYTWVPELEGCIKVVTTQQLYTVARQKCKQKGADFLVPSNRKKNRAINRYLVCNGHTIGYWIGINDIDQEKKYKWIDGTPVTYTDWGPKQPNNFIPDEDCIALKYQNSKKQLQWFDRYCSTFKFNYICFQKKN